MPLTDQEISRTVELQPVAQIASERLGIESKNLQLYGEYKAKVPLTNISQGQSTQGKLILVTAMSPTPAGEGKTTTTLGLTDGLNRIGHRTTACLREPSLGPSFGMKGGAHGGGRAQVAPMEDINLHFTGDLHAITTANNLLASLVDNHLYWGNELQINPDTITWRRALDLNDRALRQVSLRIRAKMRRSSGFDITAASEIMAVLCLSESLEDLQARLANLVVGETSEGKLITASDLNAQGALAVLLRDALAPNLVQTLEHNPVLVHGGPFANIAHGCNSILATRTALRYSDYVVTEAGFGADLGAEKFFNIKCRQSGLMPDAVVIVATIRALKMHGGVDLEDLPENNPQAVQAGGANLIRHIENVKKFGYDPVVAINHFVSDSDNELEAAKDLVERAGGTAVIASHWEQGGEGAKDLANQVIKAVDSYSQSGQLLYESSLLLKEKIACIAREIYRADGVDYLESSENQLDRLESLGFGHLPICIAKTQTSFSVDPNLLGAASNHRLTVREVQLKAGAGFVVVICGNIMTMPGLSRQPAANNFALSQEGEISGLF